MVLDVKILCFLPILFILFVVQNEESELIGKPQRIRHFIVSYQQFDYGLVNDLKKTKR